MSDGDKQFVERAKASLDQRLEQTPADIRSRLNVARHHALDSRRRAGSRTWLPAMATAALLVVVVSGVWFGYTPAPQPSEFVAATGQANDFEMITQGDDLSLYADMDFYLWLDKRGLDAG